MKKIIAIALALVMCLGIMSMVAFAETNTYYLVGYLNGADYGFEADAANMGEYKFVNGQLTAKFNQDSYVFLKTEGNAAWFMTDTYVDGDNAVFKNTENGTSKEKMKVPGNVDLYFTLVENADGSLNLSYSTTAPTPGATTTTNPGTTTSTQPTTTTSTQPTTTKPAPTGNRTLTIKAPAAWTEVNVYTWNPEDLGGFPGAKAQKDGSVYKSSIKNSIVNLVISGQDRGDTTRPQTANITLENNGKNVTITIADDNSFKIEYAGTTSAKPAPNKPAATKTEGTLSNYRVVGNAAWMGSWNEASDLGRMNEVEPGLYRKNFKNVAPGSYELKITKDGKWDGAYGDANGNNFTFTVNTTCEISVDFTIKNGVGIIEVYGTGVDCPPTGDISMLSVVVLLALASVTAIVLVVNKKKFI